MKVPQYQTCDNIMQRNRVLQLFLLHNHSRAYTVQGVDSSLLYVDKRPSYEEPLDIKCKSRSKCSNHIFQKQNKLEMK